MRASGGGGRLGSKVVEMSFGLSQPMQWFVTLLDAITKLMKVSRGHR